MLALVVGDLFVELVVVFGVVAVEVGVFTDVVGVLVDRGGVGFQHVLAVVGVGPLGGQVRIGGAGEGGEREGCDEKAEAGE